MGRGRRIIKWVKKHLRFRRKPFKKRTRKGKIKRTSSQKSLRSPDCGQHDIRGRSKACDDQSVHTDADSLEVQHPSPANSSYSLDKISIGESTINNRDRSLEGTLSDPSHNDNTIREQCPPPLLPPIEEAYMSANLKPAPLPELEITTTKQGNVAFETAAESNRPKTPMPACLSARPPSRDGQTPSEDWAKKMEVVHQRKQTAINEIRQRCRQKV